jgi:hypothetical protein
MRRSFLVLIVLLTLVAAGCGDDTGASVGGNAVEDQLEQLITATEDVRGLDFIEPPEIVIVSSDELADRITAQLDEEIDPTEVLVTQRLFELLGLLDGSIDLPQAYLDLYAEAVGGYYDDATGEMVIAGDQELSPLTRTIVVHELVHALTDQHFGFGATLDALVEGGSNHAASALQALAEGDALYYQLVYMQTLPTAEQVEAVQESLAADTTVQESLPPWFTEDLTWPYNAGFGFVERLVGDEDVPGLNQAYTLLPTTAEQIIHPGAYLTRQPAIAVELPAASLDGYEVFEEGEWGEWNLQLYLLDGVAPGEAIVGATGWGGDDYRIYWSGTDVAFAYLYEGDSTPDAEELAASLAASAASTMAIGSAATGPGGTTFGPGEDYAAIARDGKRVLVVFAADPTVGAALFDQLQLALAAA